MEYDIRFASVADIPAIMTFIDSYWRKGHILSRDRKLFEWQYGTADEKVNIVLGRDENGCIKGMLGFVPYSFIEDKDIALALWRADSSAGFLGLKLLMYLLEKEHHRNVVCPGININTTAGIYKYVGMQVGAMHHWFRLAERKNYVIAKVVDQKIPSCHTSEGAMTLKEVSGIGDLEGVFEYDMHNLPMSIPQKTKQYIERRYFRHPIYHYKVYTLADDSGRAETAIVVRVQDCSGSHALRFIDCLGNYDNIRFMTRDIDRLMNLYDCEYIDVYEAGIPDEVFCEAGWLRVADGGNIIPDYFAPFEQRNVDIHYCTSDIHAVLFKGDGDQDRPS